jgi:hypothetical protein
MQKYKKKKHDYLIWLGEVLTMSFTFAQLGENLLKREKTSKISNKKKKDN